MNYSIISRKRTNVLLLACFVAFAASAGSPARITVDFNSKVGLVKPVNGVGQPPMVGAPSSFRMMHYLKEAGIPYARLHDVGGSYGELRYVDIPNLFRDFSADENNPKNYNFAYTDSLMKALDENGVEPFFRLGVTIDSAAHVGYPGYFLDPPKDFAKWARICEHVIRHYTEGWANGFKMKVTYWEIWNEPDNQQDPAKNPMWNASFSEYIRFYGVVATYLKAKFPHLKIGGYGSCGFYAGKGTEGLKVNHALPWTAYFVECATNFLGAVRTNGWPLDFFSYHSYALPAEALRQVRFADAMLSNQGFPREHTERIFDEWLTHVSHEDLGTAKQAAGIAAELIALQDGPCDVACIYDARCGIGSYSPLFNPMTYKPHKAYYAFTAFNELRRCGKAAKVSVSDRPAGLYATAAIGKDGAAVLVANDSDVAEPVVFDFGGREIRSIRITDANRTDAATALPPVLPPHSFAVILLK